MKKRSIFIASLLSGLTVMGALTACAETNTTFAGGDGSAEAVLRQRRSS